MSSDPPAPPFAMEFLFKDRGRGKRQVKPKSNLDLLEAQIIAGADSDESDEDFKVGDEKDKGSDADEDSDASSASSKDSDDDDGSGEDEEEEEEGDDAEEDEDELSMLKKDLSTEELLRLAQQKIKDGEKTKKEVKVCGCCLGHTSSDANEIVECDGCGISVHEGCYGVPNEAAATAAEKENEDAASEVSAASTEPWFCEPCRAGIPGGDPPPCELCPLLGGIYKQTDVGRWVHLVCALYVPGVAFGDPERLTSVTVFEMNYSSWGRRACSLCQDSRMAKTGVCVQCDAGLCKSYFHALCAQANGLLTEPSFYADAESDPYLAHCKVHTDKAVVKKRKQSFASHLAQAKRRLEVARLRRKLCEEGDPSSSVAAGDRANGVKEEPKEEVAESEAQRILRKLRKSQSLYAKERSRRGECWVPTQRIPRALTTSSSAIRKLEHMGEIKGVSVRRQRLEERQAISVMEAKRRWHVPPAFSVDFVSYYHDRSARIEELRRRLSEQVRRDGQLKGQEVRARPGFDLATRRCADAKDTNAELRKKVEAFRGAMDKLRPGKPLPPCPAMRPIFRPFDIVTPNVKARATVWSSSTVVGGSSKASSSSTIAAAAGSRSSLLASSSPLEDSPLVSLRSCGICKKTREQHLMARCDTCRLHYHLGCLTPPLTRMPKKSKLYGWQCSECDRSSGDEDEKSAARDPEAPRKKRQAAARALLASRHNSDAEEEVWEPVPTFLSSEESKSGVVQSQPLQNNKQKKKGTSKASKSSTSSSPASFHSAVSSQSGATSSAAVRNGQTNHSDNKEEATRESLIALASAKEEKKRRKKAEKEARRAEKRRRKEERRRRREAEAAARREEEGEDDSEEDEEEDEESPNECEIIETEDGQCIVNIKPKKPIKLKIKTPAAANEEEEEEEDAPASTNGVGSNGHGNSGGGGGKRQLEEAEGASSETEDPPSAKKARRSDTRTSCDVCGTAGDNGNLVRCDECRKCFHFWCLSPPVKKSPKVAGYGWQCTECSPSDVDSDWHLD